MKFLILVLLIAISSFVQNDSQIGALTVTQIDSICNSIDANKSLVTGIREGAIMKNGKIVGGFSTYDHKDKTGANLYRIQYSQNVDVQNEKTFYYHKKQLIKAIIVIKDWKVKPEKTVYSASYYFDNGKLIKSINENIKYSTVNDIYNEGMLFQDEFYDKK